jgi:hypothetical protein
MQIGGDKPPLDSTFSWSPVFHVARIYNTPLSLRGFTGPLPLPLPNCGGYPSRWSVRQRVGAPKYVCFFISLFFLSFYFFNFFPSSLCIISSPHFWTDLCYLCFLPFFSSMFFLSILSTSFLLLLSCYLFYSWYLIFLHYFLFLL